MEETPVSKYKLWNLANNTNAEPRSPSHQDDAPRYGPLHRRSSAPIKRAVKLTDLETSFLLYSYGIPVEVVLSARCTPIAGGTPIDCTTEKISSHQIDLTYKKHRFSLWGNRDENSQAASPIEIALDQFGTFRGILTQSNRDRFRISVAHEDRSRLSARLADFMLKNDIELNMKPAAENIVPAKKFCWFLDHTGTLRKGTIVNLRQTNALIEAQIVPPENSLITFLGPGRLNADVLSSFTTGFLTTLHRHVSEEEFYSLVQLTDA